MNESEFDLDMDELSSAEDFLDYFEIDYDPSIVHVNRLHILQRFHDYLDSVEEMPVTDEERRGLYAGMLSSAYNDFVKSDALTEKVFKVFHMHEPVKVEIPLMNLIGQVDQSAPEV
jgi:nitrogenase-stabilizing/protective protein